VLAVQSADELEAGDALPTVDDEALCREQVCEAIFAAAKDRAGRQAMLRGAIDAL
jgi:hypothetical protein